MRSALILKDPGTIPERQIWLFHNAVLLMMCQLTSRIYQTTQDCPGVKPDAPLTSHTGHRELPVEEVNRHSVP